MSELIHTIWGFIWGAVVILFMFGVAILVHELGHFLTGKLSGVPVDVFSIGFGKKIWKRKWKGTTYAIGSIPFGGYVKFAPPEKDTEDDTSGEEVKDKKVPGEDPFADLDILRSKPYPLRLLVYSSGVLFNYLTAVFVLIVMFTVGYHSDAPFEARIRYIGQELATIDQPLKKGDEIIAVGEKNVESWFHFLDTILLIDRHNRRSGSAQEETQQSVSLTITRDKKRLNVRFPLYLSDIGTTPTIAYLHSLPPYIDLIMPNTPAEKAGMQEGDMIRAIDGIPVFSAYEMSRMVYTSNGRELEFEIERRDKETGTTTTLVVIAAPTDNILPDTPWAIGIAYGNPKKIYYNKPFPQSIPEGFKASIRAIDFIVRETGKIFGSGNIELIKKNVGGPVAIGVMAIQSAKRGAFHYFNLFVIFNLFLLIVNILPIPVLDGGHILIATIEVIIRRPIPRRILAPVFTVFFVLIVTLAIFIIYNDLASNAWRLFGWLNGAGQ